MAGKKVYGKAFRITAKQVKAYGYAKPNPVPVTAIVAVNGRGAYKKARSAKAAMADSSKEERIHRARKLTKTISCGQMKSNKSAGVNSGSSNDARKGTEIMKRKGSARSRVRAALNKNPKRPTPAQLKARAAFAAMVKAKRGKMKRNAGGVTGVAAKRAASDMKREWKAYRGADADGARTRVMGAVKLPPVPTPPTRRAATFTRGGTLVMPSFGTPKPEKKVKVTVKRGKKSRKSATSKKGTRTMAKKRSTKKSGKRAAKAVKSVKKRSTKKAKRGGKKRSAAKKRTKKTVAKKRGGKKRSAPKAVKRGKKRSAAKKRGGKKRMKRNGLTKRQRGARKAAATRAAKKAKRSEAAKKAARKRGRKAKRSAKRTAKRTVKRSARKAPKGRKVAKGRKAPKSSKARGGRKSRRMKRNGSMKSFFKRNGVMELVKFAGLVTAGVITHKALNAALSQFVIDPLLAPSPVAPEATSGLPAAATPIVKLLASAAIAAAGTFAVKAVSKDAAVVNAVAGGMVASVLHQAVLTAVNLVSPKAAGYLSGDDSMAARLSAMYGVGGGIMPAYAPISGMGEYFEGANGVGEYFEGANGVGEYFEGTNGLGAYGANPDLYQAAAGYGMLGDNSDGYSNNINPSDDLDRQLTIAEAAAGVGASSFEAAAGYGAVYQASAGYGNVETLPGADTWVPGSADPQLWAGVRPVDEPQSATAMVPAGVLESGGGAGIFG